MKCTKWVKTETHKINKRAEEAADVVNLDNESTKWTYTFIKPDGDKHTVETNHPLDVVIGDVLTLEDLARRQQRSIMV